MPAPRPRRSPSRRSRRRRYSEAHAAARDGDRRQARRGRRGRRGDEGRPASARRPPAPPPSSAWSTPSTSSARAAACAPPTKGIGLITHARRPRADEPGADRPTGSSGSTASSAARSSATTFLHDIDGFTARDRGLVRRQGRARDCASSAASSGPCPRCDGQIVECPKSYALHRPGSRRTSPAAATRSGSSRTAARSRARRRWSTSPRASRARTSSASARSSGRARRPAAAARSSSARKSYGCTTWKSRTETGCGFVIWKKVRGQQGGHARDGARDGARGARPTRRRSAPTSRSAPARRPGCGGEIVENSRAYGCTCWKSRKKPGLRLRDLEAPARRGREVTREEAAERLSRPGRPPAKADESEAA